MLGVHWREGVGESLNSISTVWVRNITAIEILEDLYIHRYIDKNI